MSAGPFVHLGGETVVDAREVVAILDARTQRKSSVGRALLAKAAATGRLADPRGLPGARAIVVTTRRLYPTPATPSTVAARVGQAGANRRTKTPER